MKIWTFLLMLTSILLSTSTASTFSYVGINIDKSHRALTVKSPTVSKVKLASIIVGGTIWAETDDDGLFEPDEYGIFGVQVSILTHPARTLVSSTTTNAIGVYSFTVQPGDYIISILSSNFSPGNSLGDLINCTPTADPNNDVDSDDNGDGPDLGPVESGVVSLVAGSEPGPNGLSNFTIDFGFRFGCGGVSTVFSESCDLVVDTFCNLTILDAGCGTMLPGPLVEPAPNPLCNGGGAPHNMSWFAFVAGSGDYAIEIVPTECTPGGGGQLGLQTGIYTDCSFSEAVFCMNTCSTSPISVPSTNLVPGNTYYWWFDGCSGSVCSYDINVTGTFEEYIIPEPTEIVSVSDSCGQVCPNSKVTLQVNGGYETANLKYVWRVTDPRGNDTLVRTSTNKLFDYLVDTAGVWKFEIISISNKCNSSSVIKELLITVSDPAADENFGTVSLCEDFIMDWAGPTQDSLGNTDPNGDGFAGWQISPFAFVAGPPPGAINMGTFTCSGQSACVYRQTVRLISEPNSAPFGLNLVLCPEDLPYIVTTDFPFPIASDLPLTLVVLDGQAANGCDSLVNLAAIVLQASGQVQQMANADNMVRLDSFVIEDFPVVHSITWKKSDGTIINDGNADADSLTTILPGSGDYVCEIVMTLAGKTCNKQIPFVFTYTSNVLQDPVLNLHFNNPVANGILYLSSDKNVEFEITVTNVNGSLVTQKTNLKNNSEIDIEDVPSGIYILEIKLGDHRVVKKLVVLN